MLAMCYNALQTWASWKVFLIDLSVHCASVCVALSGEHVAFQESVKP